MKTLMSLLTTCLISAQAHTQPLQCDGVRQATPQCPSQRLTLRLNLQNEGDFELSTNVSPNSKMEKCYELSTGKYQNDGALIAHGQVRFYPNFGAIPLDEPREVGSIHYMGNTIFLTDNFSGQEIELSCH